MKKLIPIERVDLVQGVTYFPNLGQPATLTYVGRDYVGDLMFKPGVHPEAFFRTSTGFVGFHAEGSPFFLEVDDI